MLLFFSSSLKTSQVTLMGSNSSICSLNDVDALESLLILHQAPGKPRLLPWLQLPFINQTLPTLSAPFCSAIHPHLDDSWAHRFKFSNINCILFCLPSNSVHSSVPYILAQIIFYFISHIWSITKSC